MTSSKKPFNSLTPTPTLPLSPPSKSNHQTPINTSTGLFRSRISPKLRSRLYFAAQGRTKQSFRDECDINRIMKNFAVTGTLGHLAKHPPQYGDVAGLDFQEAMQIVASANEMFASLPAAMRERFANDPGRMLQFIQNPDNVEEGIKLGLLERRPEPATPLQTPPASAAPAAPPAGAAASAGGGLPTPPPPQPRKGLHESLLHPWC